MFPLVCQDVHARMSASSFATERASPGARVVCDLLLRFFFVRTMVLDIEELQTHHIQQIILTYKQCHIFLPIPVPLRSYYASIVAVSSSFATSHYDLHGDYTWP